MGISMKNFKKQQFAFLVGMILSPICSLAQSTQSVMVPVNTQTVQVAADRVNAQIDLLKEIRKQKPALNSVNSIDIQMISFEAKSGIGGGVVYLKINQGMTNYVVVETDPDLFSSSDARSFQRFELKNNDRSRISSAAVFIPQYTNLKLNNLVVTLGSAQEPAVFGRYVDDVVRQIGGAPLSDNRDLTPARSVEDRFIQANFDPSVYRGYGPRVQPAPVTPTVVRPVVMQPNPNQSTRVGPSRTASLPTLSKPQLSPTPARPVAVRPQPTPAPKPAGNCIKDYRATVYCVGDRVVNIYGFVSRITQIDFLNKTVQLVGGPESNDGVPYWRHVDMLRK